MLRFLRLLTWPFSLLYGLIIRIRHAMYDAGILPSRNGALPTIIIGNLHAGGTGKTPHAEYLIGKLCHEFKLAFLSRGYGRKTKGFHMANRDSNAHEIGDEPMQIHRKFPDLDLAVCEDRLFGIEEIKGKTKAELILLDDAFQHRRLKPDFSILLMPYNRPWWKDLLLPAGDLRDVVSAKKRAHAIVVTKCPAGITEEMMAAFRQKIQPSENQIIAFSSIQYGEPRQIHGNPLILNRKSRIFGFAGIADTTDFQRKLEKDYTLIGFRKFADHHIFSRNEIESLQAECGNFADAVPVLITTEKDATKLALMNLPESVAIFVLPIEMAWLSGEDVLNKTILGRFSSARNKQ